MQNSSEIGIKTSILCRERNDAAVLVIVAPFAVTLALVTLSSLASGPRAAPRPRARGAFDY